MRLLGCKDICIDYFQRPPTNGGKATNLKHENTTVLNRSCVVQKVSFLKTLNGQLPRKYVFLARKGSSPLGTAGSSTQVVWPSFITPSEMQKKSYRALLYFHFCPEGSRNTIPCSTYLFTQGMNQS